MNDQLGNHRIIERRNHIALPDAGVNTQFAVRKLHGLRHVQIIEFAGRWQKSFFRIFCIDTRLNRMTVDGELMLQLRQTLASRYAQLPFHQIGAGNHLRHRVLDLQPCVHLHEIKAAVLIRDELDRSCAHIRHCFGSSDRCSTHRLTTFCTHAGRRRLFQYFLVTTLHRAIALEQADAVAVRISKNLNFDMARTGQIFFDQNTLIAKTIFRFPLAGRQGISEIFRARHHAHAFAATASTGLEQHGITDLIGLPLKKYRILIVTVIAGYQGHLRFFHQRLGCGFGTHRTNSRGWRADEY